MRLASLIRPNGLAPKGPQSIAQGLPWVNRNKRFALKGPEMRARSGSQVRNRFSSFLVAPSGLIRLAGLPRVNPGLRSLGRFGPRSLNIQHPSGPMTLNTYLVN